MFKTVVSAFIVVLCALPLAAATNYDELKAEIGAAADGGVVYVQNDMTYDTMLPSIDKTVTIRSPEGQTNVLTRAAGYSSGALLSLSSSDAHVTFADVVVDGNRAAGAQTGRLVSMTAGQVTLDAGVKLRNVWMDGMPGIMYINNSAVLEMNEGAVIRAFRNNSYGTCVLIGYGSRVDATFVMNGGLITACESTSGSNKSSYGGVVYNYGGIFRMCGGLITGNTATMATAGVANYSGSWYLAGDASVTNNTGGLANAASYGSHCGGYIYFDPLEPWTGSVVLYTTYCPNTSRVDGNGTEVWQSDWVAYIIPREGVYEPGQGRIPGLGKLINQNYGYVVNGYSTRKFTDEDDGVTYGDPRWEVCKVSLGTRLRTATIAEACDQYRPGDDFIICTNLSVKTSACLMSATNADWNVTIKSGPGGPYTIQRTGDYTSRALLYVSSNAMVRLENLIFDGGGQSVTLFSLDGGSLTLGAGCVVSNHHTRVSTVYGAGAKLVMEEGALVRDCFNDTYGTFALVGNGSSVSPRPCFEMRGGMITNCVSTGLMSKSYGGIVYTWGGDLNLFGGAIVGNINTNGPSGVYPYSGTTTISGTMRIENNEGPYPDFYRAGATVRMTGNFRGRIGVSTSSANPPARQSEQGGTSIVCADGSTGAWNFFSAQSDPVGRYVGYMWPDNRNIYWEPPQDWIDGIGFPSDERKNMPLVVPTALDLDDEAVRAALPHTFKGARARALGGTVAVTFAAVEEMKARVPLALFEAQEGAFTGTWNFTVPKAESGKWIIRRTSSGSGIVSYALDWSEPGVAIIVR